MNEKTLGKRFGAIAVEKGFIAKKQLLEAMKVQVEEDLEGLDHRLIGTILYSMDILSIEQVTEILEILKEGKMQ